MGSSPDQAATGKLCQEGRGRPALQHGSNLPVSRVSLKHTPEVLKDAFGRPTRRMGYRVSSRMKVLVPQMARGRTSWHRLSLPPPLQPSFS